MTPEEEADKVIADAVDARERLIVNVRNPAYALTQDDREIICGALRYVLETAEWARK